MSKLRPISEPAEDVPYLDEEERELIESYMNADGPLKSILTSESKAEIAAMARATMNEHRAKISLRVPKGDLSRLKYLAAVEGLPYQTLINSLIHKYVSEPGK